MRNTCPKLSVLPLAMVLIAACVYADGAATTTKPAEKYVLTLHLVYGVEPRQWVFVLKTPAGGIGITSSDRLKPYIELMVPQGATLEWMPSCKVIGGEPLRTQEELDALADFCAKRGIRFVHIPAG